MKKKKQHKRNKRWTFNRQSSKKKMADSEIDNGEKIGPFLLGETLGEGSTGKVKLGLHKQTGQKVAIKSFVDFFMVGIDSIHFYLSSYQ